MRTDAALVGPQGVVEAAVVIVAAAASAAPAAAEGPAASSAAALPAAVTLPNVHALPCKYYFAFGIYQRYCCGLCLLRLPLLGFATSVAERTCRPGMPAATATRTEFCVGCGFKHARREPECKSLADSAAAGPGPGLFHTQACSPRPIRGAGDTPYAPIHHPRSGPAIRRADRPCPCRRRRHDCGRRRRLSCNRGQSQFCQSDGLITCVTANRTPYALLMQTNKHPLAVARERCTSR